MRLTEQQLAFVDTFGYLGFPGLLKDRIDEIIDAFESVWTERGGGHDGRPHDGTARSCIVPFIDQHPVLSSLIDDPRVNGIFSSLLGDDFVYLVSDGNFYVSDTNWHSDTDWSGKMRGKPPRIYFKMAFYLDPLTRDSGALRVIPGSHRYGDAYAEALERKPGSGSRGRTGASRAGRCPRWRSRRNRATSSYSTRTPSTAPGEEATGAGCSRSIARRVSPRWICKY